MTVRKISKVILLHMFSRLPLTRMFGFKVALLNAAGIHVAPRAKIVSSAKFITSGSVDIGQQTWVGHEALFIGGDANIRIGADVDIAPRVLLATGTHEVLVDSYRAAGKGYSSPIVIGDGCWICVGAVILGGTEIGACSIVAAGSVVKGTFPPRSLIGGTPAKVIRTLEGKNHSQFIGGTAVWNKIDKAGL